LKAKKLIIALSTACALAIPFTVFAATSDASVAKAIRGFGNYSKLTDQQKADVKEYSSKMADVQKDFINKMIENGAITKEQGQKELDKIDKALESGKCIPYFGMGKIEEHQKDNILGIKEAKLTEQQKAGFKVIYTKIADANKAYLELQVSSGLITREQADIYIKKIDDSLLGDNTFGKLMVGVGQFTNKSKLTDQQKSDREAYIEKLTGLQTELINKAVENGAITKEQGDRALERLKNTGNNGFMKDNGKKSDGGKGTDKVYGRGHGTENKNQNNSKTKANMQ